MKKRAGIRLGLWLKVNLSTGLTIVQMGLTQTKQNTASMDGLTEVRNEGVNQVNKLV